MRSYNYKKKNTGADILNSAINQLPFELHIPGGYQYCGPGTKLQKRLKRGDPGINPLDQACKEHDIAYDKNMHDIKNRHIADKILASKAWMRVKAKDASLKEKAAAVLVTGAMKAKMKLGMGLLKKRNCMKRKKCQKKGRGLGKILFKTVLGVARRALQNVIPKNNLLKMSTAALKAARQAVQGQQTSSMPLYPINIPIKKGGFLPLIPLFAGLSAIGGLAGGAAGIATAVNKANAARKELQEAQRHNRTMEALALHRGKGLYLAPYKKGLGLYLQPKMK